MALGWMTSATVYHQYVRKQWFMERVPKAHWDYYFVITMMRDKTLECECSGSDGWLHAPTPYIGLFPEISRTHHRRNDAKRAYSTSEHLQSQYLDKMMLADKSNQLHDQSWKDLAADQYENRMKGWIKHGLPIQNLDEARNYLFHFLVYVCVDCEKKWDTLMVDQLGLFGTGPDYAVRGLHKGSVTLRYMTNLLVILSPDSPYISEIRVEVDDSTLAEEMGKPKIQIVTGREATCDDQCAVQGLYCHEQFMTFANDCVVMKQQYGCTTCERSDLVSGPQYYQQGRVGGGCQTAYLRNLKCSGWREDDVVSGYRVCGCGTEQMYRRVIE